MKLATISCCLAVSVGSSETWVKCCHWSTRRECGGDGKHDGLCPASCTCDGPGWMPRQWAKEVESGSLLAATYDEMGGVISNGYVGAFVPRAVPGSAGPNFAGTEHVKGVFNGDKPIQDGSPNNEVYLAALSSWATSIYISEIGGKKAVASASALDLQRGSYNVVYPSSLQEDAAYCITRTYAHRKYYHLMVTDVVCDNVDNSPLRVRISHRRCLDGPALYPGFCPPARALGRYSRERVPSWVLGLSCTRSIMSKKETPDSPLPELGECHSEVPLGGAVMMVEPGSRKQMSFISARVSNMDNASGVSVDTVALAKQAWKKADENAATLFEEHAEAMMRLNTPGIEVGGNVKLARLVNASLYTLLGVYRDDSPYTGAPEGLAAARYGGHAFWDVETWQWPTLLAFWPDMARSALNYRARLKDQAAVNAKLPLPFAPPVNDGLRYPWESALSGIELAPSSAEDHINGDIALAFKQYWFATKNASWLQRVGFPIIEGIARFYASRVTFYNGSFHIRGTQGPDEYHTNVTDSTFGNALARSSLNAAYDLARHAGASPNATFKNIADHMYIPYDPQHDYHPEFIGFNASSAVKQADTVLMSYPLRVNMSSSTRLHDIEVYSKAQDPHGVAMVWAFNSIAWRDVGNEERAAGDFYKSFKVYSRPPFYAWHEANGTDGSGSQGAPNFVTGAGGFLQAVWAGYGGLRFEEEGFLTIRNPRPLPDSTFLRLRNIHFLGARLNLLATLQGWTLSLSGDSAASAAQLEISNETHTTLLTPIPIRMPFGSVAVVKERTEQLVLV